MLVKARKFLNAHTDIQNYERETAGKSAKPSESELALSPLMSTVEDRNPYQGDEMTFSNIAGVLPIADKVRFERMLFRATRGNCYVRFSPLSSRAVDAHGEPIAKICFIIFYKSTAIETKIKRICDAFSANRYDLQNLNKPSELDAKQQVSMTKFQCLMFRFFLPTHLSTYFDRKITERWRKQRQCWIKTPKPA